MRQTLVGVVLLLLLLAGCAGGTGSKSGGVPRSALAGQGLSVDALAIDPRNAQTVYALRAFDFFKSTDGGATWRRIDFPRTAVDAFAFAAPANLYLTGTSTVDVAFRSLDGGTRWQKVRDPFQGPVNSFAVAPSDPQVLYAAIFSTGSGVFKSTDGGRSWRTAGLTGTLIDALAVDPKNPKIAYAVHHGGPFQSRVFRTANGGLNWQAIGTSSLAGKGVQMIAVDPRRPRILYAPSAIGGVFTSIDGGVHWRLDGLRDSLNQIAVNPRNPRRLYAALVDDGVFQSLDAGRSWHRLGLPGENVDVLAISSDGRVLYAGTDDDGVMAFHVRR